jgi:hypothetical protein
MSPRWKEIQLEQKPRRAFGCIEALEEKEKEV